MEAPGPSSLDLGPVLQEALQFRAQRDWERFHTPKNLAVSLSLEVSELLEHFQWTDPPAGPVAEPLRTHLEHEVADIALYLLLFCHDQQLDLAAAIHRKLQLNAQRYPAHLARGKATKYTQLQAEAAALADTAPAPSPSTPTS